MNERKSAETSRVLTRRALMKRFALSGAVFAVLPRAFHTALAAENHCALLGPPVVSFYMDRLHVDRTGAAIPYRAPRGMRSGAPLAHLSEEAFRCAQLYV